MPRAGEIIGSSKVRLWFRRVRAFVAKKFPDLARIELEERCPVIKQGRNRDGGLAGRRYFCHAGHHPGMICAWSPAASRLKPPYLVGIFLHEFGHEATGGGEFEADSWVLAEFGIPLQYKGPLSLEWVSPRVILERGI